MGRHDLALRTLESTRRELMELALACGARERTVSGIASCADGSAGPALVESAANLRSCLQRVEREQGVLREAIGGVLGHVRGVWSQVERSMDQSGTYSENSKIALMKVLELDPKNVSANINLGIIYYNQGVNLINSMDIDTPLDKLEAIQDNSVKLFKQSLPFMTKVYQLDPKNVKALESLRQIYQALNDDAKKEEFNKKLMEARGGSDK